MASKVALASAVNICAALFFFIIEEKAPEVFKKLYVGIDVVIGMFLHCFFL